MELEDELLQVITNNQKKREETRKSLELLNERWAKARDRIVRPRLEIAASFLNNRNLGTWSVDRDNGGVFLRCEGLHHETVLSGEDLLENLDENVEHSLSFFKDDSAQRIVCRCSKKEIEEKFTVSKLTRNEVDRKIKEFVDTVTT